jgi:pimeloyl-ACP methyl ester carboxylesterase
MKYLDSFTRKTLIGDPERININGWTTEYLAFAQKHTVSETPLILLPGAFQNYLSYSSVLDKLMSYCPVIMVDLPAQGSNMQLGEHLSIKDLADLLKEFIEKMDLPVVNILGMSYGSLIGSVFASSYPERIEKLAVVGIAAKLNQTMWAILSRYLSGVTIEEFANYALTFMINHDHRYQVGINDIQYKLFNHFILRLKGRERFLENTKRLFELKPLDKFPTCPTLVATGEYDNFTLPHENLEFAANCENSEFALIKNADHLSMLERSDTCCELLIDFFGGKKLASNKLYTVMNPAYLKLENRRVSVRTTLDEDSGCIVNINNKNIDGIIDNISFYGCRIQIPEGIDEINVNDDLLLFISSIEMEQKMIVLDKNNKSFRGFFAHANSSLSNTLTQYLSSSYPNINNNSSIQSRSLAL